MTVYSLPILLLTSPALLGTTPAVVQPAPDPTGMVEVRFTNGSVVMMHLLQEHVEIQTDYGRLTVPHKDIRHIEFGLRTTEDERHRIDDAIQRLASNDYQDREAAVRNLVALGPAAYLRLQTAPPPEEAEVVKRTASALKRIRESVHPRMLRTRDDDIVRTAKFTIVGRIMTPTLKANAEEFGELDLRPSRLLSLRWLAGETSKELVIDAGTYAVQGSRKWLDTGVRVNPQIGMNVTASGQIDLWPQQPGQYVVGPDGQAGGRAVAMMMVNARAARVGGAAGGSGGELLGRIGEDGTPFLIGSRFTKTPKDVGNLFLQIVPSPWGPSTGEYRVTVKTGPFADDSRDE